MTKVFMLSVCVLLLASCTKVSLDRGTVKEKFITSSKYGQAYYHATTNKDVYDIDSHEYATLKVGDRLIQQESQINGHVLERGTICAAWAIFACIMILVCGFALAYFIFKF
jgi:hypothetical protein